jgi:hypothetical protein
MSDEWNGIFIVISRSLTYVYWLFPVIYVFWPKGRRCGGGEGIGAENDETAEIFDRLDNHITVDGSNILYPS